MRRRLPPMEQFRREYLLSLPLPLAQLYARAYNAKDARGRHDNSFYIFEAMVKLCACVLTCCYAREARGGAGRCGAADRLIAQLAAPSLGQWVALVRELSRWFAGRGRGHPLGGMLEQLQRPHGEDMAALYRRIKNGPDGQAGGDRSCSVMQLVDALVQYRNAVFGHGGGRLESFYGREMGPLLYPAATQALAEWDVVGPAGSRLVHIGEMRVAGGGRVEIAWRELVGLHGERLGPLVVEGSEAAELEPDVVGVQWPGMRLPLRLDPLVVYREGELSEEVLLLNRDRGGRQVEYVSYTTGRTERQERTAAALGRLLGEARGVGVAEGEAGAEASGRGVEGDYEIVRELGRGGMGVVYLARQASLGRLVALKTLPGELAGDEAALGRFRREMRALARCEHPNIVKVLGSGTLSDGRLYYAMEYVPGCDLELVWRELSRPDFVRDDTSRLPEATLLEAAALAGSRTGLSRGGSEPAAAAVPALGGASSCVGTYARKVVELLRGVALALQAVHEQGIVHRDVKPANLMLTADGRRVVLMDFGLARGGVLGGTLSVGGGFAGTLRYAAPEQLASGRLETGPAADVRALGVVLWEMLTRRRLFGDAEDERQLAMRIHEEDVPLLRSVDGGYDRDLEALVARATERRVADRTGSAGELAQHMGLWLEGRALPIRTPGVGEMLLRWGREHWRAVAAWAAGVAAVVATVAAALVLITLSRNEAVRARAMEQEQRRRAEAALVSAETQRQRAEENFRAAREAVDRYMTKVAEESLLRVPGLQELRRQLLAGALEYYRRFAQQHEDDPALRADLASAYFRIGRITADIGSRSEAAAAYERAIELRRRLAASEPENAAHRESLAGYHSNLASIQLAAGRADEAMRNLQTALDIRRDLAAREPTAWRRVDLASTHNNLGILLSNTGRPAEAMEHYRRAQEICGEAIAAAPADAAAMSAMASACMNTAGLLHSLGKNDEAAETMARCLSIRRDLAAAAPGDPERHYDLAIAHSTMGVIRKAAGNAAAASASHAEAITILQRLSDENPRMIAYRSALATALSNLGSLQYAAGAAADAIASHRRAIDLRQKMVEANPGFAEFEQDLAAAWNNLGAAQKESGRLAEAMDSFTRAVAIQEKLAAASPAVSEYRAGLAMGHYNLGLLCSAMGRRADAVEHHRRALDIRSALAGAEPEAVPRALEVALDHYQLGVSLGIAGRTEEAAKHLRQSLEMHERLAREQPAMPPVQKQYIAVATVIAAIQADAGDRAGALRTARTLGATVARAAAQARELRSDAARALAAQSYIELVAGMTAEAVASAQAAVEMDAASIEAAAALADALLVSGEFARAMDLYAKIRDGRIGDSAAGADLVRRHLQRLRQGGIVHPDIERAEAAVGPATRPAGR